VDGPQPGKPELKVRAAHLNWITNLTSAKPTATRWFVRATVSSVALGFFALHIDSAQLIAALTSLSFPAIVAAALLAMVQLGLAAERWYCLNAGLGLAVSRPATLKIYARSLLIGALLPGGIGTDAARGWAIYQRTGDFMGSVAAILLDRVSGLMVLAAMIAAGGIGWLHPWHEGLSQRLWMTAAVPLATAAMLSFLLPKTSVLIERWRPASKLHALVGATLTMLRSPSITATLLLSSVAIHCCSILAIYALARGVGAPLGLADAAVLVPPIMLAAALPVSLGGWGIREGVAVVLFAQVGISRPQALAISITFGVTALVPALIGGISFLGERARRSVGAAVLARPWVG
jgi:glycosyltransferase 2 family protein